MNLFWYIFFTFAGFVQIYKAYINSKCIYKSFTIRKLISSRYSLNTEECDNKYDKFDPVISFQDERITLPSDFISYISKNLEQKLPTQEDIESAQQYQDKVFNTQVKTGDEIILKEKFQGEEENYDENNKENNNNLKNALLLNEIN